MQRPCLRFTVRSLMAIIASVAFLLWLIPRWETDFRASQGVGHVNIPLEFVVSDADSGQPIEGAVIRLQDFDNQSNPIPPYFLELKTGRNGHVTTLINLAYYIERGIPSGKLRLYRVDYPRWKMKVEAYGYQDFAASFADYERGNRRFHENAPPPSIVTRMRRAKGISPEGGKAKGVIREGQRGHSSREGQRGHSSILGRPTGSFVKGRPTGSFVNIDNI